MKGKGIVTVAAAMLTIFLALGFGSGSALAQEKEIVIGSVQDLSGPWSAAGKVLVAGRADYARYVNEKLGGVDGFKLKVITIDTGYNVDREVSAFKKFLDVDNAVAMINANSGAAFVINNMMAETGRGMP
ncbi:MAG: ABC transporter substrate-binding protein, partial [Pseudomonadota bacterium]